MAFSYKLFDSPVGQLKLIASEAGLAAILWENDDPRRVRIGAAAEERGHPVLLETERQLRAYFTGRLQVFSVPLDLQGTPFQNWRALLSIPFGEIRTYRQIAEQIGKPTAFRAVGAANGKNPISIIAPCHRVVGSDGSLTGFAGRLGVKQVLLELEGAGGGMGFLRLARDGVGSLGALPERRPPSPSSRHGVRTQKPPVITDWGFCYSFEIVKRTHTFLADLAATYSPKP